LSARPNGYPLISDKAVKFLLVFSTIYLRECWFSSMIYTKNKYRNRTNIKSDLGLKLTQTEPDTQKLSLATQARPSQWRFNWFLTWINTWPYSARILLTLLTTIYQFV
jgi:hypothetical protein